MPFLKKNRIAATDLFRQAYAYVADKYGQSRNILTPASPFTQILQVLSEYAELIFMYIENGLSEMNILNAKNAQNIRGIARLSGHDAFRGSSALGRIQARIKPGAENEFDGEFFVIPNYSIIKSLNNNLLYMVVLDRDFMRIERGDASFKQAQIVQGLIESQTTISDGSPFFSFSAITPDTIDHFYHKVRVNGELYEDVVSLYDMQRDQKACIVKTGINGGLDIYFGNENFGYIPEEGSTIEVEYMVTNGSDGNIPSSNDVILTWQDSGYDKFGEEVDLNEVLQLDVLQNPSFGSDSEDPSFTKLIAPSASRSFVLANPDNYIYFLRRYNYFSHVDAYTTFDDEYLDDDNVIYLFLIPDVTKKLTSDTSFFTIPEEEFTLTDQEESSIKATLNESGQQMVTAEVKFIKPTIVKYSLSIVLSYFDKFDKEQIRTEISTKLSEYFLSTKRRDKVPKSDIVALVENVDGVDSVNVFFISQNNEEAINNGYYVKKIYGYDPEKMRRELIEEKKIALEAEEDPSIGIDEFGDIKIAEGELAIIRGGWNDRNGNTVEEFPNKNALSGLNIYFKEKVPYDTYNKINSERFKKLK